MDKQALLEALMDALRSELDAIERAAQAAREGATHPESVAEDKYDTRGLEASYLAGAQATRVKQLRSALGVLRTMSTDPFGRDEPVRPGALVELEDDEGERAFVFIALAGGGTSVELDDRTVRLITPQSPLGSELIGRVPGDDFELDLPGGVRAYEIVSVS